MLERLEEADLAHQLHQDDAKAFAPIPLPSADDESLPDKNIELDEQN
jgi:hypothetical protein